MALLKKVQNASYVFLPFLGSSEALYTDSVNVKLFMGIWRNNVKVDEQMASPGRQASFKNPGFFFPKARCSPQSTFAADGTSVGGSAVTVSVAAVFPPVASAAPTADLMYCTVAASKPCGGKKTSVPCERKSVTQYALTAALLASGSCWGGGAFERPPHDLGSWSP